MNAERKSYKTYTREFKLEAVRLLEESGRPPAEIAMELGIRRNQLYKWKEQLTRKGESGHMRGAILVGRLQLVANVTIERQRQPLLGNGRSCNLPAQTFEFFAFVSAGRDPGVQREASCLAQCGK